MVRINIDSQSLLFKAQKLNDNFMMLCASHFGTKHCLLVWQIFCLFLERGLHSCCEQELLHRPCMRRPMAIYVDDNDDYDDEDDNDNNDNDEDEKGKNKK